MRDERFKFHKVVQRHYSGEVEKGLNDSEANLSRKPRTKFYQNCPCFIKDITKNILGLFFSGHTVYPTESVQSSVKAIPAWMTSPNAESESGSGFQMRMMSCPTVDQFFVVHRYSADEIGFYVKLVTD